MADIKDQLVRLGAEHPDLRNDIRPILKALEASSKVAGGGAEAQVRFKNHGLFKGKAGRGNLEKAERMSKRDLAAYIAEAYAGMEDPYTQVDYWMDYPKAILDIAYADLAGG